MSIEEQIRTRLEAEFAPESLEIINESHLHQGHASSPDTGESHFKVVVVSEKFNKQPRVARQRSVYNALKDVMSQGIHALSMDLKTPEEKKNKT